jgi:hypothetical protein
LEFVIDKNKPIREIYFNFLKTMDYIDSHPALNYTSWKWLKLNSARVDEVFWPGASLWELNRLAYNLKTREQRQEVLDFFDNYPLADRRPVLDIIDRNIRWMDKNLPCIAKWLKDNAP